MPLLETPAFLSAICTALLPAGAGARGVDGDDVRRMACVSRCWCANVAWAVRRTRRAHGCRADGTADGKAEVMEAAGGASLPGSPATSKARENAEAFLNAQRRGCGSCWARAVASPVSAEASQRDSRACTILYALLRLGVVGKGRADFQRNKQRVCVHSVGTDAVEGATVKDTLRGFEALR